MRLFCRRGARFAFEWHLHVEVELTLITRGSGRRFVGDAIGRYRAGDFVLLGSETPHTWASDDYAKRNEAIVLQVHPDAFEGWPELAAVRRLIHRAQGGLLFHAPAIASRFQDTLDRRGLPRWLGVLEVLDALAGVRPASRRRLSSLSYRAPLGVTDPRAHRALALINTSFLEPMSQAAIAAELGMSPAGFARFFRRVSGDTFTHYVRRLRIAEACRLLSETDRPITDIAYASGFGNLSYFNRVFRRLTGQTPRSYR